MKIQQSSEDYLEAILVIKQRLGQVRAIDIANELNISKPSVSVFIRQLRDKGFISVENLHIELTESGKKLAENVFERHTIITKYLEAIGVSSDIAKDDACRIEHVLSVETFQKIKEQYIKLT